LLTILRRVGREGYAENHEETAEGLYAASVPVRNAAGAVLAALTMCIPTSRVNPDRRDRVVADLLDAGRRLSAAVPWLPAWNALRAEARELVVAGD
jgi:DNA-binding IclR family transcriptional regulator